MAEEVTLGKWDVKAFETVRGEKPVEKFIVSQSPQTIAKITRKINLLETYGQTLGMPHSKKLSNQLYELRIRGIQEIRILYGFGARPPIFSMPSKNKPNKFLPRKCPQRLTG